MYCTRTILYFNLYFIYILYIPKKYPVRPDTTRSSLFSIIKYIFHFILLYTYCCVQGVFLIYLGIYHKIDAQYNVLFYSILFYAGKSIWSSIGNQRYHKHALAYNIIVYILIGCTRIII